MNLTIVLTTFLPDSDIGASRFKSCMRALDSWVRYLRYEMGGITLLVVNKQSYTFYLDRFMRFSSAYKVSILADGGGGVGQALNMGFMEAFNKSSLVLYAADDWALTSLMDVTPWARLLMREPDIGMVRLGPPHPHLTGTVRMFEHGFGLVLDRHHYAFGHRPALYHRRMIDAYGPFPENVNALECERIYNETFCATPGPDIVYALAYPWLHVGETEVGDIEP